VEPVELVQGGAAEDPVGGDADILLELRQRHGRVVAEDAVDPAGVEAHGAEPLLELGHVVAPEHGRSTVEQAVTEAVARFDQRRPGLRTADTVDPEPTPDLELPDGGLGVLTELAGHVRRYIQVDGRQPALQVLNVLPAGAPLQRGFP
jgi:hypothetical protein